MSIDKIMDTSKEIFKLNKEILSFKVDENKMKSTQEKEAISEEEIIITNLTSDYLAFKTMTTKKSIYSVDPSYVIIPPKAEQKLKILLYNILGEKLDPKGHKFRFEGFTILESEKDSEAKQLFNEYVKKGNTVVGNIQKRSVQFLNINETIENEEKMKKENNDNNNNKETKINEENDKKENEQKDDPNKNMPIFLFIGVLLVSVVIGFYMFK